MYSQRDSLSCKPMRTPADCVASSRVGLYFVPLVHVSVSPCRMFLIQPWFFCFLFLSGPEYASGWLAPNTSPPSPPPFFFFFSFFFFTTPWTRQRESKLSARHELPQPVTDMRPFDGSRRSRTCVLQTGGETRAARIAVPHLLLNARYLVRSRIRLTRAAVPLRVTRILSHRGDASATRLSAPFGALLQIGHMGGLSEQWLSPNGKASSISSSDMVGGFRYPKFPGLARSHILTAQVHRSTASPDISGRDRPVHKRVVLWTVLPRNLPEHTVNLVNVPPSGS